MKNGNLLLIIFSWEEEFIKKSTRTK